MLKVEKGIIGNKQLVSLDFTKEDREVIKRVAIEKPKFYANNGCGLNLVDMLQGKLVLPCTDTEFKYLKDAVKQFNEEYFLSTKNWESDYNKLKEDYFYVVECLEDKTNKYNKLKDDYISLQAELKNILALIKLLD